MRKINWGVLGTAGIAWGCTIPGMALADNCALYAVAGRSPEKAERYREAFGFERAYDSYEKLLADPAVEAVYIPLPNSLHCQWVVEAARAGKHILCEKPLAVSAAQAEEMFRAAEENGVILMEAFACLHSPLLDALKAELESGVIGDVCYMENAFLTSDYELSNIRMRRETYGGSAYDLGCYCTSQILWLLGEPDRIEATADFTEQNIDRFTTGYFRYKNGCLAHFTCGMVLPTEKSCRLDRLQIQGTKGLLRSDAEFNQAGELHYEIITGNTRTVKTVSVRQNYSLEIEQMGRCIDEGAAPRVSKAFSLMNARALDGVLKAIGYNER